MPKGKEDEDLPILVNMANEFIARHEIEADGHIKLLILAAVAHGVFEGVDALMQGIPQENGENMAVTAIELSEEASAILVAFSGSEGEDEDGECDDDEDLDDDDVDEDESEVRISQEFLTKQTRRTAKPFPDWQTLTELNKGKAN